MHAAPIVVNYLWLILALPALGVLFNLFVGTRGGKAAVSVLAPGMIGGAFLVLRVGEPAGEQEVRRGLESGLRCRLGARLHGRAGL